MPPETFRSPFERTAHPPRIVVVIPARFASTRLPEKALADIAGRPMIEHVYRRAAATPDVDAVVVATDDLRIVKAVEAFGGVARMTAPGHRTGTDRVAEVATDLRCDFIMNVQGDEPLIEPEMIRACIEPLLSDSLVQMSTVCSPLVDASDHDNPDVVKVVLDLNGDALYFSRAPVPFVRDRPRDGRDSTMQRSRIFKHFGVYGFRRDFLMRFATLAQTPLETTESLEQLRALEHGFRIRTTITHHHSIGVDTAEDLERVRHLAVAGAREAS